MEKETLFYINLWNFATAVLLTVGIKIDAFNALVHFLGHLMTFTILEFVNCLLIIQKVDPLLTF